MSAAPNLLMVCYFYPPAATGVRRLLSLVRHLPEHGWRPLVVCCRDSAGMGLDASPLVDPAIASIPVRRTESLDPYRVMARWRARRGRSSSSPAAEQAVAGSGGRSRAVMAAMRRHVFFPDDRAWWVPFAVRAGLGAFARYPIRAIYSSNYPQSAHLAALRISERTGLPWLADFRDGWTQNPAFHDPGNPVMRWLQAAMEVRVASEATRLVTVSPPITRHLQAFRPASAAPAVTIYNGFEADDAPPASPGPLRAGRKSILYTGTFFGRRKPDLFMAALGRVLARRPEWREALYVRMRCTETPELAGLQTKYRLDGVVEVLPPVSFAAVQEEQRRADGFLLVLERGPGAEIMVSQKVFEYLAARRPILALVPEGAAAEVLRETGGATFCTSARPDDAAEALERYLEALFAGNHPVAAHEAIGRFDRREQAAAMARELDGMVGKRS